MRYEISNFIPISKHFSSDITTFDLLPSFMRVYYISYSYVNVFAYILLNSQKNVVITKRLK